MAMSENYLYLLYSLFAVFGVLLLIAAVYDGTQFIIPNPVVVGVAALFFVAALVLPFETPWWSHIGAAVTVFAVGLIAYRFRALGAGDVKLITAVSLWTGFEYLPHLLLWIALAGGAITLGLVLVRLAFSRVPVLYAMVQKVTLPRVFNWGEPIPYGVAIAMASLYLGTRMPHLLGYV